MKDGPKGFCRLVAKDHATGKQLGAKGEAGPCCSVSQCLRGRGG